MLASIKTLTVKTLRTTGSVAVFILMLPLTLAAMLLMMIAGFIALLNIRSRLKSMSAESSWQSADSGDLRSEKHVRPPIEGSYTVVRD